MRRSLPVGLTVLIGASTAITYGSLAARLFPKRAFPVELGRLVSVHLLNRSEGMRNSSCCKVMKVTVASQDNFSTPPRVS